jgi:hypothetical protein
LFRLITKTSRSKPCKKTEVREITSLKTSPEVGKITLLNTSPKETNLVKKYCQVGKNHIDEKDPVPRKLTLENKSSAWPRETPVRVGVFVNPALLFKKN